MKKLFSIFAFCFLLCSGSAQERTPREATAAEVTAGTKGAPAYITPRRLAGAGVGISSNTVYQMILAYGGGTNGGGGVVSNGTATLVIDTWYTNTTDNSLWVIAAASHQGGATINAQCRVDVDFSPPDGVADWWRRTVFNAAATGDTFTDIKELSVIVPPGAAFQFLDDSPSGTVTLDNVAQLVYLGGTNSGSGGTFDGNLTNATHRGLMQFLDGAIAGTTISGTNAIFDTGVPVSIGTNNPSGADLNVQGTTLLSGLNLKANQHYSKVGTTQYGLVKPEQHSPAEVIYYWGGHTLAAQAYLVGSYEEGITNGRFSYLIGELGLGWNIGRSTNTGADVTYLTGDASTNLTAFVTGASASEQRAVVSYRREDDRNIIGGSTRGVTMTGTNLILSVGSTTLTIKSNEITSSVGLPASQAASGAIQYNVAGKLASSEELIYDSAGGLLLGTVGVAGALKLYDASYDDFTVLSGDSGIVEFTGAGTTTVKAAAFQIGTVTISSGSGTPEGAVTAVVGSLFLRTDGSTSTTLYVKTSGSGNTGWTAK